MTRRLVVTGVDGFVGRHLARIAAEAGIPVFGISRTQNPDGALSAHLSDYVSADLRNGWPGVSLENAGVIHLAGLAAVGPSFDRPQDYIAGNSAMVTHLGQAALETPSAGRIVVVSTGAVYAQTTNESPRAESDPVADTSPYVVSKLLVEHQAAYYRTRGIDAVVARPFNHFGPGQGPGFIVPDLLAKLRALEEGAALDVGNLTTRRDYTDVRDVARAYLDLVFVPTLNHDTYNIASGVSRSGHDILGALCAAIGREIPPLRVDGSKIRPTDPASIAGDATRLRLDTGWAPRYDFGVSASDAAHAGRT